MSTSTSLETLPLELKVQILLNLPDVPSLTSLRHASPTFQDAYNLAPEEIITAVTLNELAGRGIAFEKPCDFAEYVLKTGAGKLPPGNFASLLRINVLGSSMLNHRVLRPQTLHTLCLRPHQTP